MTVTAGSFPAHMHFQPLFALDDLHRIHRAPGPDDVGAALYGKMAQRLQRFPG